METLNYPNYSEFKSDDENGEYCVTLTKGRNICQLTVEMEDGDNSAWVNLDLEELLRVRELLDNQISLMVEKK